MPEKDKNKDKDKGRTALKEIVRLEIRISGSGGQGVISSGMLLGEAIAIGDGLNVTQSQSYGPEARGGATRADVIVSRGEIFFPECATLDLLIAFTYEAYEKYAVLVKPEGRVLADETAVEALVGSARTLKVPFIKTATEKFKSTVAANMLALGVVATYTGCVTKGALREAVKAHYEGSGYAAANLNALEEGFEMGSRYAADEKK